MTYDETRRSREYGPEEADRPDPPMYEAIDGSPGWAWKVVRHDAGLVFATVVASCVTREARDAAMRLLDGAADAPAS